MIPKRLRLRNFLSYRECTLEFEGLGLVLLSGKNGHGKSALLDAMTWATWGRGRGRREEDRIRLDADEMLVEFQFEVDGQEYLVVRKRTRGRSAGGLEFFQVDAEGGRISLTGSGSTDTQNTIIRILRLDFETFLNSAFIAQGKANEFTNSTAGERKAVLAKILGLEVYDRLRDLARDERRTVTALATTLQDEIERESGRLAQRPVLAEQLAAARMELGNLRAAIEATEVAVARHRAGVEAYETIVRAIAEAEKYASEVESDQRRVAGDIEAAEKRIAAAATLLARGEEIEARYRELGERRGEEEQLAARQRQAREAEIAIAAAEKMIGEERARLESAITADERLLEEHQRAAAGIDALTAEGRELTDRGTQLEGLREEIRKAAEREQTQASAAAEADATMKHVLGQAEELKGKEAQLDGVATCPICRKPLSPGESDEVRAEYAAQRKAFGEQYRLAKEAAEQARKEAAGLRAQRQQWEKQVQQIETELRRAERDHHTKLARANEAVQQVTVVEVRLLEQRRVVGADTYAAEARARLAAKTTELNAAGYDPVRHDEVRQRIGGLAAAEQEYQALGKARSQHEMLSDTVAQLRGQQEELGARLAEAGTRLAEERERLANADDVRPVLEAAQLRLREHRARQDELVKQEADLASKVNELGRLEARLEEHRDAVKGYREEESTYEELVDAFGRNGIQAMLIDQAIPRIEARANDLLDHMTGGRIHVGISTQSENLSGTVRETLDIRISDELGTRDYELFSGGEAFRVDFALRVALAQLLAERAGASLPTLIIDEGFGTQDAEGIERLIEALNAVRDDFRLILVVTHLEELKVHFDHRIEVTKEIDSGSMALVV